MQTVPTLGRERLATKLVVAGHTPYIRLHAEFLGQNSLRAQRLIQDWTAAKQLNARLAASSRLVFVKTAENAFAAVLRHGGHGVTLIVHSDVVEQILTLLIHTPHAILDDYGHLINKGRIIARTGGNRA